MFQNTADMPRIGKELDRLKIIWRSKNLSIRNHKSHISSILKHNFTVFCLDCLPRFSIFFHGTVTDTARKLCSLQRIDTSLTFSRSPFITWAIPT